MNNEIQDFTQLINLIEMHRQNAYRKVNEELVTMYYEIGRYLSEKIKSEKWSSKTIDALADSINHSYPNLKGFTRRGYIEWLNSTKPIKIIKMCQHCWHKLVGAIIL